jgi:hypothetical protein
VQDHGTDQLHVERDHVPGQLVTGDVHFPPDQPAAGVLDDRIGFALNVVQGLAVLQSSPELVSLGPQLVVGQRLQLLLEPVDLGDQRAQPAEYPFVPGTQNSMHNPAKHGTHTFY